MSVPRKHFTRILNLKKVIFIRKDSFHEKIIVKIASKDVHRKHNKKLKPKCKNNFICKFVSTKN